MLEKLVIEEAEENESRDFKAGNSFFNVKLPEDIAKKKKEELSSIWSECLDAFANNTGGVLI